MPRKKPPARRRYDTDLTDAQWELLAPLIPEAQAGGRPRKATSRELVDSILYFLRAGMVWRLPTTCHRGRRSITICAAGSARGSGRASITPLSWPTASGAAGRPRPRRRSSTASRCAPPIKRGRQGV